MGDSRAGRLLRIVEGVTYWTAAAPVLARLPAAIGYRIACWRGDWLFRYQARRRTEMARNLRLVLGNELSPAAARQVTRDWFRFASCDVVDVKRLRHGTRPLQRLVEIDGREHLEAALAAAPTSAPTTAASRCCTPAASRSPPSGAGGSSTSHASHPPSGGSGTACTPGRCGATGSGRTSSHGLAGPRSRRWQPPHSAPMTW